ncbi:hypothetical protein [Gynuella sunshinyii]|uniref:Uncharacterized protein n=1 Tax=Gynuella sunshinyii YC6258 TaxID=1445510 RepID=A0A0C5VRN3_9GAMM|nr:hypothetical protein [Gynuella sunshinyii]AJQ96048.1 hypothetical Protein YC6258_04012 [Gynuella sunshinyii YC6258]
MKKILFCLVLCISFNAAAVEKTPIGKITGYYTGWNHDQVRVTIEGADYTEGNCETKDGYVTEDSDNSGYKTHISALLAAYMAGKPVGLIVEGCLRGRPKIWGVNMEN